MATRLSLICHPSTAAVRAAAFPADEPLDRHGRQALAAVEPISADRCWTSPALRARETAAGLDLDAAVEPLLRDCDYGRWTGRSFDEVQAREPDALLAWSSDPAVAPHGGESLLQVMERVAAWLDGLAGTPGRVIAVTHASVVRAAIIHAIGAPPPSFWRIDVAPLSLARLGGNAGRWNLAAIGPLVPKRD